MSKSSNKKLRAQRLQKQLGESPEIASNNEDIMNQIKIKKLNVKFRNASQEEYWNLMSQKEITLCAGPAGTGKSHLCVAKALDLLSNEQDKYKRIIITTPAVEADENLGFLPGEIEDKLSPYTYSTLYLFEKILSKAKVDRLREKGRIEVLAFAYMRGINLDNCIVIAEEVQNATARQIKTLLTRIGENAKFFLSGDMEQSDKFKDSKQSGLFFAMNKLKDMPEIGIFEFKPEDIIRNPLISKILTRFNGDVK